MGQSPMTGTRTWMSRLGGTAGLGGSRRRPRQLVGRSGRRRLQFHRRRQANSRSTTSPGPSCRGRGRTSMRRKAELGHAERPAGRPATRGCTTSSTQQTATARLRRRLKRCAARPHISRRAGRSLSSNRLRRLSRRRRRWAPRSRPFRPHPRLLARLGQSARRRARTKPSSRASASARARNQLARSPRPSCSSRRLRLPLRARRSRRQSSLPRLDGARRTLARTRRRTRSTSSRASRLTHPEHPRPPRWHGSR